MEIKKQYVQLKKKEDKRGIIAKNFCPMKVQRKMCRKRFFDIIGMNGVNKDENSNNEYGRFRSSHENL